MSVFLILVIASLIIAAVAMYIGRATTPIVLLGIAEILIAIALIVGGGGVSLK
jgi:hypothetical protein